MKDTTLTKAELRAENEVLRDSRDRLRQAVKERDDALSDLLDGASPWDVEEETGLPLARCEEICEMGRYEGA